MAHEIEEFTLYSVYTNLSITVCVTAATMYWRERGQRRFDRKLDSGDGGEHPRGARSGAPLARGEGPHLSTKLLDRGVWPLRKLHFA
jgi:hypothetical protein